MATTRRSERTAGFVNGVWYAIEYLVTATGDHVTAAELARNTGIGKSEAMRLSKATDFCVDEMQAFIRDSLTE